VRVARVTAAAAVIALGVRLAKSRTRRSLHPDGRSFTGELEVWGAGAPVGARLIDRPGRHPVTVRLSKGLGTRPGRPDVLGLAIRVHGPERPADLLLSTAGRGRLSRHVPMPRHQFSTGYGSITSYRTGDHGKIYLAAGPQPHSVPLGRTLETVRGAAGDGAELLLYALRDGITGPFGRITFGTLLPPDADAALAFDAIRNSWPDLHPSGTVHSTRALAYRLSQRWRGAEPAPADPQAVARTAAHR
jgi:hypothetical protein